ncbi:MAG TPA: DMT family transporter [Baekduia sp.]|uniref:DMT family transporter n=1 Tax=Baekduia sp. TaxID=2600305 RepID=UPI002C14278C|nr:DMT family transporter [Baekduia sp.]HMJ34568.1 DMT family transporter [Baekduia sp.]
MAIALAITAAACWGLSDFLAGLASRRVAVPIVLLLVEGGGLLVVATITVASGEPFFTETRDALSAIGGGLAGVLALGCFYRALAIGTMSVVAPISATGAALPVVAGVISGDRPSLIAAAGLAAIVIGVVLASRQEHADAEAAAAGRTAIVLALISAVGFGGFFVLTNAPADASVLWTITLARAAPIPLVAAVVLAQRPRARPSRRLALGIAAVGTIDLAATSLVILANTKGDLSVVGVLGGMYPVATVLLAAVVLHERLARLQQVGVVLALGGIAAVAAG